MAQDRINDDIFRRLDTQDAKLDKIAEDVAYMRGLQDGAKTPHEVAGSWMNKQNAITAALASLISTIGAVLAAVFAVK